MSIQFDILQTMLGVGAGFFIAAPMNKHDPLWGILMIVASVAIGFIF